MLKDSKQVDIYSTRRIEAITDGVFAIAMTLLVLGLNVPKLVGDISNQALWSGLKDMLPNFLAFIISFSVLGIMWGVHMRQFESIKRVDKKVTTLNTIRLFIVILIPFTAELAATYPKLSLAQFIYPLNLFILALITYLQGKYVSQRSNFYDNYEDEKIKTGQASTLVFVLVSGAICVLVLPFGSYAFFAYLLIPILIPALKKYRKKS